MKLMTKAAGMLGLVQRRAGYIWEAVLLVVVNVLVFMVIKNEYY